MFVFVIVWYVPLPDTDTGVEYTLRQVFCFLWDRGFTFLSHYLL